MVAREGLILASQDTESVREDQARLLKVNEELLAALTIHSKAP